jgi:predicted PurR-regulated permease PerM
LENTYNSTLHRLTLRTILLIVICFILIYTKSVLIPFTWALMISLASMKFVSRIKEHTRIPYSLIIILYLFVLFLIIGAVFIFFTIELRVLLADSGMMQDKLSVLMNELSTQLKGIGFSIPDHFDPDYFKGLIKENNGIIVNMASGIGTNLWDFLLVIFYTFFLLYYKDIIIHFAEKKYKNADDYERFKNLILQILDITQQYIVGMFLLGLIIAVMSYFLFIAFGIKAALFFAIFFGIMSLIPVIGVPMGMIFIGLFALISKDSVSYAIYISFALFILNFLQDNVFRPLLMGSKLSVNAFAVFFFVILGGFFWGVSGMILFIPLASILKIILDRSEMSSHYSVFLSEPPKVEKSQQKHFIQFKKKVKK